MLAKCVERKTQGQTLALIMVSATPITHVLEGSI